MANACLKEGSEMTSKRERSGSNSGDGLAGRQAEESQSQQQPSGRGGMQRLAGGR